MLSKRFALILVLSALLGITSTVAQAGCGCDHPPAEWAQVMPPFGSKGKKITIFAVDGSFSIGDDYHVDFGGGTKVATASQTDRLEVRVPGAAQVGPIALRVSGPGYDHTYDASLFTKMAKPRRIRNGAGFYDAKEYNAAVGHDGTLYLALDMRRVLDPRQFLMGFLDLALSYSADDVVIYNADGIDLTLFTAAVSDPTERQWGSYYGWDVEGDSGLASTQFESKTDDDAENVEAGMSNLFTYWRHEFRTYADAHAAGGSHEVEPVNGLHPDGTRHIDHYNLVIAIRGQVRNASDPFNADLFAPLEPGSREVHLGWVSFDTEAPFEPGDISDLFGLADGPLAEMLEEIELEGDD